MTQRKAVTTNYLLPQQKLISKHRYGAKVTKKHDKPATPHQRAIAHPAVRKRPIITMNAAFKRIKPAALQRAIMTMTGQLETLSLAKTPATQNHRSARPNTDNETTTSRRTCAQATTLQPDGEFCGNDVLAGAIM